MIQRDATPLTFVCVFSSRMQFALDESETLSEFRSKMSALVLILLLFQGIQSAPSWSPSCLHECWCHETSATSVTDGWKLSVNNRTQSSVNNDIVVFRAAICVQQHDTDIEALLASLPAETEAIQIIQAPDAPAIRLTSIHLSKFNNLLALSLEGFKRSSTLPTITLHSDSLLAVEQLQYLSLTNVELLDASSTETVDIVPVAATSNNENPSNSIYFLPEVEARDIVPYEEFKKIQQTRAETTWKGFTHLKNLEYLIISHCRLPEAFSRGHSGAFTSLIHLKELVIQSSQMRVRLETESGDLKELESLSLSDNELLDLQPGDLRSMDSLHTLDLSGNQLTRLTENSFPLMPDLESLDLSGNPLRIVYSKAFVNVSSLRRLLLGSYRWKDREGADQVSVEFQVDSFYDLAKLRELWIGPAHPSGMGLGPDYFRDLISLVELHIRGKLVSIDADTFSSNRRLQIVDLKRCHLRRLSVDSFQSLTKLRILDLSDNQLDQLAAGVFDPLVSLKELWLNGNRLTSIPARIFSTLTTTKLIRLEANPWHCTCQLNQLKATSVNKVTVFDAMNNRTGYQYDRKVAPLCASPEGLKGASVFDVMRKPLRCNKAERLQDQPEFRRIDVWNEPLETIDHGPEATDEQETSESAIIPAAGKALDHVDDIIDHGDEVVEDIPLSKPINEVLPESYNSFADKGSIPNLKSSYYSTPTISKKSLKLLTEREMKDPLKKKYI